MPRRRRLTNISPGETEAKELCESENENENLHRDWAARQDYQHCGTAVEACDIGGWTLIAELNGYRETLHELLEALSEGGEAVVPCQRTFLSVNESCWRGVSLPL